MLKKLIVTAAVLAIVTAANATISAGWGEWSTGTLTTGDDYFSYRITVDVTDTPPDDPHGWTPGPDDWTAAGIELGVTGGIFYHDPVNDGNPPNPSFFAYVPDSEFTSYWTSPADFPNTDYSGTAAGIASTADTTTLLDTDWFDTIDTGNGTFVIGQITVLPDDPASWDPMVGLSGMMQYAARNSGGHLFELIIPEPGTLALLALGGLALIRRR
jgi:hypothetical protein